MSTKASDFNVVIKLFDFEKELGEISAGLLGREKDKLKLAREGCYDLRVFKRGEDILREIKDYLEKNEKTFGEYHYGSEAETISTWIDYLESEINVKCVNRYPWKYCDAFDGKFYKRFIEKLRAKGIKCGFIEEGEEKVSFVRVLESLRNCLHTLGIEMAKVVGKSHELEEETKGICKVIRLGERRDEAFEICKIFAKHVIKNSEFYDRIDAGKQSGIIYGDEVQFRIGGAAGHASILNLKKGEFKYDDHHEVRLRAVKEVLESMGLLCELREKTLVCKGVDFEKGRKIAKLLAFLPSLDIHIDNLIDKYVDELMETCIDKCVDRYEKKFIKECEEEGYEGYAVHVCVREKCEYDICYPELGEEARRELEIISAGVLENAIGDEEYTYEDVVYYMRDEVRSIIEGLKEEEFYY